MNLQTIYKELNTLISNSEFHWNSGLSDELEQIFFAVGIFPFSLYQTELQIRDKSLSLTGVYTSRFGTRETRMLCTFVFQVQEDHILWNISFHGLDGKIKLSDLCGKIFSISEMDSIWDMASDNLFAPLLLKEYSFSMDSSDTKNIAEKASREEYPYHFQGILTISGEGKWSSYPFLCGKELAFSGRAAIPGQHWQSSGWSIPFSIEAALDGNLPFSSASTDMVTNDRILSATLQILSDVRDEKPGEHYLAVALSFVLQLPSLNTPARFSLPLFAQLEPVLLETVFENGLSVSSLLNTAAAILHISSGKEQLAFPDGLPVWDAFRLYSVRMYAARKRAAVPDLSQASREMTAAQNTEWEIFATGILAGLSSPQALPIPNTSLESLACELEVTWVPDEKGHEKQTMFNIGIAGNLVITLSPELVLRAYGRALYPEYEFTGILSLDQKDEDESTYTFNDIANCFSIPVDSPLTLASLMVTGNVRSRSFSLIMEIKDVWKFKLAGLTIAIEQIEADLSAAPSSFSFGVYGNFSLDTGRTEKSVFYLAGGYRDDTWAWEGGLETGTLYIIDVVKALFLPDYTPNEDPLWNIALEQLHLFISRGKEERISLSAVMSVSWKLELFNTSFLIRGNIDYERTKEKKRLDIGGEISVGSFLVRLTVKNVTDAMRSYNFWIQFKSVYLEAVYEKLKVRDELHDILTVRLGGFSIGDLISAIGNLINPNGDFSLSPPWDFLEKIKLDDFRLVMDISDKSVSILYDAKLNIAGLMYLDSAGLRYEGKKAEESLHMIVTGRFLDKTYDIGNPITWDIQNEDPPSAGKPKKFELVFLAVGQHVACDGISEAKTVADAVQIMKDGIQPRYREEYGFLFAAEAYLAECIHAQLVLNDPNLYGLLLTMPREYFNLLELWLRKQRLFPGMVWVRLCGDTLAGWQFWTLRTAFAEQKCCPSQETFTRQNRCLAQKGSIGYFQYRLGLPSGTNISWTDDTEQFIFYVDNPRLPDSQAGANRQSASQVSAPEQSDSRNRQKTAVFCGPSCMYSLNGSLTLSFAERNCGQFQGEFAVSAEQIKSFFQDMQIGLCYQTLQQPDEWEDSIYTMRTFPHMVSQAKNTLQMHMTPNSPLTAELTWLSLSTSIDVTGLFQDIYGKEMQMEFPPEMKYVFQPEIQGIHINTGEHAYTQKFYLTPEGAFSLHNEQNRVLCGLNGNEYLYNTQNVVQGQFHAGNPAFFPFSGNRDTKKDTPPLVHAQTAYVSFGSDTGYYSQAPQMRLFARAEKGSSWLQPYDFELTSCDKTRQIPYFPYSTMETISQNTCYEELETMLSRHRLSLMKQNRLTQTKNNGQIRTATRHGLLAEWKDKQVPEWIGIYDCARNRPATEQIESAGQRAPLPDVRFTGIRREFFHKLLEKEVLLLYTKKEDLLAETSSPFYVDSVAFQAICREFPGKDVSILKNAFFETETLFLEKVKAAVSISSLSEETEQTLLKAAADFSVEVAGWNFQLSPHCFRKDTDGTDTLVLIKYATEISIAEWMADTRNKSYVDLYQKAVASPERYEKLLELLHDQAWCGILYLNVPVYTKRVQEELSFLLEDIDSSAFYSAYVALGQNQIISQDSGIVLRPGGISALIDYEEPRGEQLGGQEADICFRTVRLKLDIRDSEVTQFESTSELTIERLFESNVKKEASTSGNAMIMDGSCQMVNGAMRYLFRLRAPEIYQCDTGGIQSFWIKQVHLLCDNTKKISLKGSLILFHEKECDILSYGKKTAAFPLKCK